MLPVEINRSLRGLPEIKNELTKPASLVVTTLTSRSASEFASCKASG
jgi:hypothetical protein